MAKVLLVDDNVDMLETLEHLFTFYDFEVARAVNGAVALEIVNDENPDIIILDALMPVMNGFDTCEHLKTDPETRDIPIIFLSANYTEKEHRRKGLELGADDYILKPFNAQELIGKVNFILKRQSLLAGIRAENDAFLKEFEQGAAEAERDHLTGLLADSAFLHDLRSKFEASKDGGSELSLLMLDVDHFSKISGAFGDATGNYVLNKIVHILLRHGRKQDYLYRLDRNRFCILMADTGESIAFSEAEKLRTAIEGAEFLEPELLELHPGASKRKLTPQNITVSVGIATAADSASDSLLLKSVEEALGRAKATGRNVTIRTSETIN